MIDIADLQGRIGVVGDRCWPLAGAEQHARKLAKEAIELAEAQGADVIEEAADCLICLLMNCEANSIGVDTLLAAAAFKVEKCARRKWERQPDGTYQHIKP